MDNGRHWTQVFYGGAIPDSQMIAASNDVVKVAMVIRTDLRNKLGTLSDEVLNQAITAAFDLMNKLGATSPDEYRTRNSGNPNKLGIKVFQHALERARELIRNTQDMSTFQEPERDKEAESGIKTQIYALFDKYCQQASDIEDAFPALWAWKKIIDKHVRDFDLAGYAYYLLTWDIPQRYNFYDHDDLIAIHNAHPRLHARSKSRMQINGQPWRGKYSR